MNGLEGDATGYGDGYKVNGSILDLAGDDNVELLLRDKSVLVRISAGNEFLQFFLADVLPTFLGDPPQIFD